MKHFFQSWLDQRGVLPGVLLCGISMPDRTAVGSSRGECPLERLEEILRHLVDFSQTLVQHRVTATRLLWTFENAKVHWTVRPDNVGLAVFAPADTADNDPSTIDRLVAEFHQLRPN